MQQIDTIYASLLVRQEQMMKDSSIFVFDVSKELLIVPMDPLFVLLYVTELLPVVPSITQSCGGFGNLASTPTQLEREPNKWTKKEVLAIVNAFVQDLPESTFIKIGAMLQKFIATKKQPTRSQKVEAFPKIKNLQLSSRLTQRTKQLILKLWFSNAIEGPFCITRALDYMEFDNDGLSAHAIRCQTLTKLKKRLPSTEFWAFKMQFIIIMDKHYFVLSGRENEMMKYRLEIPFCYIGLRDIVPITPWVKEIAVAQYQQLYIQGFEKIDCNGYRMVIVKK